MRNWRSLGARGSRLGGASVLWALLVLGATGSILGCDDSSDKKVEDGPKPVEPLAKPPPGTADVAHPLSVERAPIPQEPLKRSQSSIEDTTLIPGRSVGPVDHLSSREDLAEFYGEDALLDRVITLQDGSKQLGTRIRRVPGEEITVIWWDDRRRTLREARDPSPKWVTPEGIHKGMTLEELEAVIGPFQVFGFGWEEGGSVKLKGTTASEYHNKLHLRMVPTKRYPDVLARLSGDTWYDSSDKNLKTIKPILRDMVISLEPEGRL